MVTARAVAVETAVLLVLSASVCTVKGGLYIMADYYMDPSQSSVFGGRCGRHIQDSSAFISSHMNPFKLTKYGTNKNCRITLDAGSTQGARYRLDLLFWDLENSQYCDVDYLEIFSSSSSNLTKNDTSLVGRFCGGSPPNITTHLPHRYSFLNFVTDSERNHKGFRFMAVRSERAPCHVDQQFLCASANRCLDHRLQCDGTDQCGDSRDELGCDGWEVFLGVFLALGLGGLVAVLILSALACGVLCVVVCCCTCCKKRHERRTRVTIATGETASARSNSANGKPQC